MFGVWRTLGHQTADRLAHNPTSPKGSNPVRERHVGVRPPARDRQRSDDLDGNSVGVGGDRFDIGAITGQDRPAGLGESDDESVDR